MKRISFATALILLAALVGCRGGGGSSEASSGAEPTAAQSREPSPRSLEGLDARQAMALANTWKWDQPGVESFVDQTKVSFTFPSGRKKSVRLPEKEMVIAVAPYINQTHPCEIHYMSGCQGELVETPVRVEVIARNGETVVDEILTTQKNGFVELWLPRNQTFEVTVEHGDRRARGTIATFDDSDTCITTFKLL